MRIRHLDLLGAGLCLLATLPGAALAQVGDIAWHPPLAMPSPQLTAAPLTVDAVRYTGLVIDASGLGFEPCMSPGLIDADDRNLLAGMTFDPDQVADRGLASWVHSNPGPDWPRIGPHPLEVKALRADGDRLVLSDADAQRIKDAEARDKLIEDLKVTIVY